MQNQESLCLGRVVTKQFLRNVIESNKVFDKIKRLYVYTPCDDEFERSKVFKLLPIVIPEISLYILVDLALSKPLKQLSFVTLTLFKLF